MKSLIIPIVVEQFLALLVGIADTLMISHVGEAAVSGVSLINQLNHTNPAPVLCLFDLNLLGDILDKLLAMTDDANKLITSAGSFHRL